MYFHFQTWVGGDWHGNRTSLPSRKKNSQPRFAYQFFPKGMAATSPTLLTKPGSKGFHEKLPGAQNESCFVAPDPRRFPEATARFRNGN